MKTKIDIYNLIISKNLIRIDEFDKWEHTVELKPLSSTSKIKLQDISMKTLGKIKGTVTKMNYITGWRLKLLN